MPTPDADRESLRRPRLTGVATLLSVLFALVVAAAIALMAADLVGAIELKSAVYAVFYLVVPVVALALIVAIAGRGSKLIAFAAILAVPLSVAAGAFLVVSGLSSRVAPYAPPGPDTVNPDEPHKSILPDAASTKSKVIGGCNRSNAEKLRFNRDLARETVRIGDVGSAVNAATTIVGCYSFEIKATRYLVFDAFAEERAVADPLIRLYSSPAEDLPPTLETGSDDGGYFRKGGRISWFLPAGTYIIEVAVNGVISDRIADEMVTLTAVDASPGTTYGPVDALEIAPGDGAAFTSSAVEIDGTLKWFLLPEIKKNDLAPPSGPDGASAPQRCIVVEIDSEDRPAEASVRRVVDAFWMRATPAPTLLGGENWIIFPFDDYNATQDDEPGGERNFVSIAASNFEPGAEKQVFMAAAGVTEGSMEVTTRGPFKIRAFYATVVDGRCLVNAPEGETPASEDGGEGAPGG